MVTTEEVWGLDAVPGECFSLCQEGICLQFGPSLFCSRFIFYDYMILSLPFILALETPGLKSPFHPSPIATFLVLIPPPASSTLILPQYDSSLETLFSWVTSFRLMVSFCQSRPSFLSSSLCQSTGYLCWYILPNHIPFPANFSEITCLLLLDKDQFGEL